MSKLSNIPIINQSELLTAYNFSIVEKQNIIVLGPSGAGKTEMGFQAGQMNDCNVIYWNMSVMERPDIQGLPALANDKKTSFFAPQEGMPFVGFDNIKKRRNLQFIIDSISESDKELGHFVKKATKELANIKYEDAVQAIKECSELLGKNDVKKAGINPGIVGNENSKNVLFLDEIDKTPPENLQPLLELLLYRSINHNPLDIRSVMMTANLPDEHTYSEPLSHAITNRAMVFELNPSPDVWLEWAKKNNLHPMIIGFLSRKENAVELFNKRPVNNDMYNYAYTSPRAWAKCSQINYKYDTWLKEGKITDNLRKRFNSSVIGDEAATKLDIWLKYYSKYSDLIDDIFNGGNPPPPSSNDSSEDISSSIVIAIAIANKFSILAKSSNDTNAVQNKAAHVFGWISKNVPKDVKAAAFRSSYDRDAFRMHNLHTFDATKKLWQEVSETYDAMNKIQSEKL